MLQYQIFAIKKDFAYHYYYKGDMLYRFIQHYVENKHCEDFSKQYHYITRDIPENVFLSNLKQKNINSKVIDPQTIQISDTHQKIYLQIHKRHITIYCPSLIEPEKLIFPLLRKLNRHLFVVGINVQEYGWLTSLSKIEDMHHQELYSFH